MAAEDLKSLLELSKKADKISPQAPSVNRNNGVLSEYINKNNFEQKIAELDEAVYGKYVAPKEETPSFNAYNEIETMKKGLHVDKTLITNPILMEVANNPIDTDVELIEKMCSNEKRIEELAKKSMTKNMNAIDKSKEITKQLVEKDKAMIVENKINTIQGRNTNGGNIDYSLIKMIVENVLDEKMKHLSNTLLTESRQPQSKTSMIMLGENFTFVDSEGNMYKCGDMKYIGKAKMKKKQ